MHPEIDIRLFDLDGTRMAQVERNLRHSLKQHGIDDAQITCVGCGLEIARQGFTDATPALSLNQYAVIKGREISEADVEWFCGQLVAWRASAESRASGVVQS